MFSSLSKVDLFSIYFDWVHTLHIVDCILLILRVVDQQLGLLRAELHLVLVAEVGCQVEQEVELVDVIG